MGIPCAFRSHPVGSLRTPPFQAKGGKKRHSPLPTPCHRQLCHCLTDQVGQELIWLSCSGLEVVSSHHLWDVLTEEMLSQARAVTNSRGTPQLYQSPRHLDASYYGLLRNPLSLMLVQNFLTCNLNWVKSCGICMPTHHSNWHPW